MVISHHFVFPEFPFCLPELRFEIFCSSSLKQRRFRVKPGMTSVPEVTNVPRITSATEVISVLGVASVTRVISITEVIIVLQIAGILIEKLDAIKPVSDERDSMVLCSFLSIGNQTRLFFCIYLFSITYAIIIPQNIESIAIFNFVPKHL